MAKTRGRPRKKKEELATFDPGRFAIAHVESAELNDLLQENLANEDLSPIDFDRIRVPSGGGVAWEIIGENGEPEPAKNVSGVIAYQHTARTYWREGLDEGAGAKPPDCYSNDGRTGYGDIGLNDGGTRACISCPLNQWGSDDSGAGKACRENRILYLLRENELLPTLIVVPPTSLRNFKRYLLRLTSRRVPYHSVVSEFELDKAQSGQGITYSQIKFSQGPRVPQDLAEKIQAYSNMLESLVATTSGPDIGATVAAAVDVEEEAEKEVAD